MKVLVIPEDFRKDQFLLKPLFKRLFVELKRPKTKVQICREPLLQGVNKALKKERLAEVFERYGLMHGTGRGWIRR